MKTKELIRQLQKADPSGEEEVCVGNSDIHFVELLPAYYDGPFQLLIRDHASPYYNIIGGKFKREGSKVKIHSLSFSDVIGNDPAVPIDYSELDKTSGELTKKHHDGLRAYIREIENQLELENFMNWFDGKLANLTADREGAVAVAREFFDKNIRYSDPVPADLKESYVKNRQLQWDRELEVLIEDGYVKIRKKN